MPKQPLSFRMATMRPGKFLGLLVLVPINAAILAFVWTMLPFPDDPELKLRMLPFLVALAAGLWAYSWLFGAAWWLARSLPSASPGRGLGALRWAATSAIGGVLVGFPLAAFLPEQATGATGESALLVTVLVLYALTAMGAAFGAWRLVAALRSAERARGITHVDFGASFELSFLLFLFPVGFWRVQGRIRAVLTEEVVLSPGVQVADMKRR